MRPKPKAQLIQPREKSSPLAARPPTLNTFDNFQTKVDNENNTSIDADFLLNGNLGGLNELSDKSPIELPVDIVDSEKSHYVKTFTGNNDFR